MILPLQNFATLLEGMSASLQGSSATIVDLSVGSVMRAVLEACASVALWMQWLILQVLSMTRAATSTGSDLDSWMADYSLARLPGAESSGTVVFGRYTVGLATTIPVGTVVKTTDGLLTFSVLADETNPAWNGNQGYYLPASVSSLVVAVQATLPGAAGNVLSGAIGLIASAIIGVDTVTNTQPLAGGVDPETDAALRGRFQLYINSRSLATRGAVGTAVQALQQGLRFAILENVNLIGKPAPGNFCVVVDNGSGIATASLLSEVSGAVDAVRPLGSTFSVTGPAQVPVTIQMNVLAFTASVTTQTGTLIQQAITSWVGSLPMGGILALSKLEAIAHATDASVASVLSVTINSATVDIQAPAGGVIQLVSVDVSVE